MLMVIFGAGASYDSSPDLPAPSGIEVIRSEPWRPPLTKDLFLDADNNFGAIILTYTRLRGILPFLRQPPKGRSVEQQLALYQNEAPADEERSANCFPSAITYTTSSAWFPINGSNTPTVSPTTPCSSIRSAPSTQLATQCA